MSSFHQKITRHTKKQEVWPIQRGKKKAINRNCPLGSLHIGLLDKDLKSSIINMFKELKEIMSANREYQ